MKTPVYTIRPLARLPHAESPQLLRSVERLERKAFPSNELFDFQSELRKQNTTLLCMYSSADLNAEVVAYLVYARTKRVTLLHKVCVQPEYRRKGYAKRMIQAVQTEVMNQGCDYIQLWVSEDRHAAKRLYLSCGFEQVQRVKDYYTLGRDGLRMVCHLSRL